MVYKYHEHDTLLESNNEQQLSEEEKADAWAAYENDVKMKNTFNNMTQYGDQFNMASAYNNFSSAYGNMFNSFPSNYALTNPQLGAYLNQLAAYSTPSLDLEAEFLRQMYAPYAGYNNLYGAGGTSPAASNMYGNSALLPSSPPSVSSPSPGMAFNALNNRNLMQPNQSTSSSLFGHGSNYLSTTGQSSLLGAASSTKSAYNAMMSNPAMQMYFNAYAGGNSGGSLTTVPTTTTVSKSTNPATSAPSASIFDAFPYFHQSSLLGTNSGTSSSSNSPLSTTAVTQAPTQQGPNAKKNPMLSKELSIPSLMPTRNPFDPLNSPSIPTSVITKSGVNTSSTTAPSPTVATTTVSTFASKSISSPTVNSPTISASIPNTSKENKDTTENQKSSPEPHIIVKNVNAINKSVTQKKSTEGSEKPTETSSSIQQRAITNMGIVYPDRNRMDTNKSQNLTVAQLKSKNMGIVYPTAPNKVSSNSPTLSISSTTDPKTLRSPQLQVQALNAKTTKQTISSADAAPMTALAAVNKGKLFALD